MGPAAVVQRHGVYGIHVLFCDAIASREGRMGPRGLRHDNVGAHPLDLCRYSHFRNIAEHAACQHHTRKHRLGPGNPLLPLTVGCSPLLGEGLGIAVKGEPALCDEDAFVHALGCTNFYR
jgi:hypothetical protein